jgi:hypothetical protein
VICNVGFAPKPHIAQNAWHGSAAQDWLEIDLLKEYAVVKVIFYNRKDCCHSRANNALLTLMDSSRTIVQSAVLNSDIVQSFTFSDNDSCNVAPNHWQPPRLPHSAVFVSDSVMAVLSRAREQDANISCAAQLHLMRAESATALWSACVNVSLGEEGVLLFDREQRLFSLFQGDRTVRFDAKGVVIESQLPEIGRYISSNAADSLETDLAAIVARDNVYSHCNLFTGFCQNLVNHSECGVPVLAAAYGLHAYLKCSKSDDMVYSQIAGCEASSKLAVRLSGCVGRQSSFVSTMNLHHASSHEATWLWAVSFHLDELHALLLITASLPHSSQHSTVCAQFYSMLTYIDAARASAHVLLLSTRRHLDYLGVRHSVFDAVSCIGASGAVNTTAVVEVVEKLQRLHPWPHAAVSG